MRRPRRRQMDIPHSSLLRGVATVLKEQAKILDSAATLVVVWR